MKRCNFFLPLPTVSELKIQAEKTGLKMSELIRRAIDEYLRKKKKSQH